MGKNASKGASAAAGASRRGMSQYSSSGRGKQTASSKSGPQTAESFSTTPSFLPGAIGGFDSVRVLSFSNINGPLALLSPGSD